MNAFRASRYHAEQELDESFSMVVFSSNFDKTERSSHGFKVQGWVGRAWDQQQQQREQQASVAPRPPTNTHRDNISRSGTPLTLIIHNTQRMLIRVRRQSYAYISSIIDLL